MRQNNDLGLLIIRFSVGILMLLHGIAKLKGVDFIGGMLAAKGLPEFMAYGVYVGEIIAPILIIIGYRTRLAAFIFAGNVAVAAYLAYANDIFSLNKHGGWELELLGLYFFGALALILMGGGKFAVSRHNSWD
ncbi:MULTISPECIES: DoxX family protein [unclassified Saccharicrinis]|uniref:DoxX family protein n=1 Tax=unclassified Saccharicrinis TaxID=2646859 RepID=UPI003D349337